MKIVGVKMIASIEQNYSNFPGSSHLLDVRIPMLLKIWYHTPNVGGCKFNLSTRDAEIVNGILLLKDFISNISKIKKTKNINISINLITKKISESNYIFLSSISTIAETGLVSVWDSYREKFERWLADLVNSYCLNVDLDGLSSDYKTRVALELLLILAKDIIENRFGELSADVRDLLTNETAIRWMGVSLNLIDLVGWLYPSILSLSTSGVISYGTEPMRLVGHYSENLKAVYEKSTRAGRKGGSAYKIYKLIYLPLTSIGLASEYTIPIILGEGPKYRYTITGTGHNFMNSLAFTLSQSFNRVSYEYILNNFVAISHVFKIFVQYYLNRIFSIDEFSVAKGLIEEYFKYVKDLSTARYFAYNVSDALKDIAIITLTLLSQYHELRNLNASSSSLYEYNKFLPAVVIEKPLEETIKYAIKRLWIYSQR